MTVIMRATIPLRSIASPSVALMEPLFPGGRLACGCAIQQKLPNSSDCVSHRLRPAAVVFDTGIKGRGLNKPHCQNSAFNGREDQSTARLLHAIRAVRREESVHPRESENS